jgi:glycosyltransferase involved in cell wall biosynthesis
MLLPLAASASPQTAIVRTINGRGWTFSSRTPAAMALRLAYIALQRAASTATDATVFEHGGDQSFFKRMRLIGKSRSVLIPGAGIDVGGFEAAHRSGPSRDALRKEFGLEGAEIVTTVTRVTREKGVIPLLQAADIVSRVRPSMRLLVVGPRDSEGPFAVPQHEFDKRRPYVLATGTRTDVPSLLGMSDVFAFPSEYAEGVPRAVMEAALCGLPIVATDIAGCREVINDGWNGLLTPKRNPARLAERIMELLENREAAQRMGARGPELIRSRFSLDAVVRGHADLYRVVLAGGTEKGRRASPRDDRPAQRAGAASLS